MNLAKLMLAGVMLAAMPSVALAQTLAQQSLTGMITGINRINGTIGIQQTQSGTVGANTGSASEQQFKAAEGLLDTVHAGDRITFSVSEIDGNKTITKIEPR